jgi:hypothetical protein
MTTAIVALLLALGAEPADELKCLTDDERAQATLSSLLQREADGVRDRRTAVANDELADRVRTLLGIAPLSELPEPTGVDLGRVQRETYHIDRLVLKTPSSVLPGLTFHPKEPRAGAYLYLHEAGKLTDAVAIAEIEQLVAEGNVVVTIDLRGQGETADAAGSRVSALTELLGKSLLGMHVEDTLAAGHFVAYYQTSEPREVHLIGIGQSGVTALHAAALRPDLFTTVTLRDAPRDWASVVGDPAAAEKRIGTVRGALALYDLPDLVNLIGAERVTYVGSDSQ